MECNAYLPKLDDITGYKFKGWSLAQEGARDAEDKVYSKNSGDKLIIDKPTKLYALWEEENYKVIALDFYRLSMKRDWCFSSHMNSL